MASFEAGKPIPLIIQEKRNGPFVLQEEALSSLLLCPEVKDKPVCVVAIAGAFRKGKSFLMNFFRRYCLNIDSDDWLDEGAKPINGFTWKQGMTRETTGIMAWSKPLICKNGKGEEVGIIFVDSQGTFDPQASNKESTVVFALTAMFSSILVYNLTSNIQENHLSDLQTFMVYGKSVAEACGSSQAFQSVLLLVRDWEFPNDLEYGYGGGQTLLNRVLKVDPEQAMTQQETRKDIKKCFSDINCFLMPHPGSKVNKDANFSGRLDEMKPEFQEHLRELVPSLLHPDNLVKKQFKGEVMSGQQLFDLFKNFVTMIKKLNLPEPFAFAEAAARASSETASGAALEKYKMSMQNFIGDLKISVSPDKLENWHLKSVKEAMEIYVQKNKIGEMKKEIFKDYQDSLEKSMSDLLEDYRRTNNQLVEFETEIKKQEERRKAMKLEAEEKLRLEKERMIKLEQEREIARNLEVEKKLEEERQNKLKMEGEMKKLEIERKMELDREKHEKEMAEKKLEEERKRKEKVEAEMKEMERLNRIELEREKDEKLMVEKKLEEERRQKEKVETEKKIEKMEADMALELEKQKNAEIERELEMQRTMQLEREKIAAEKKLEEEKHGREMEERRREEDERRRENDPGVLMSTIEAVDKVVGGFVKLFKK